MPRVKVARAVTVRKVPNMLAPIGGRILPRESSTARASPPVARNAKGNPDPPNGGESGSMRDARAPHNAAPAVLNHSTGMDSPASTSKIANWRFWRPAARAADRSAWARVTSRKCRPSGFRQPPK